MKDYLSLKKSLSFLLMALFALSLNACHTIEGAGKDIEDAGEAVQDASDSANQGGEGHE